MLSTNTTARSNHNLFIPYDTGSPHDSLMTHIAGLGPVARLDFERCAVTGEVIYAIEGDSAPVSQQAEEARIGTLAYAIRKLGDAEDAAEFIRCLNAICEDGDARCRQTVASHYFNEIGKRGASDVLKEMGLFAMQLAGLNPVTEVIETETPYSNFESEPAFVSPVESEPENIQLFFEQEVGTIKRMIRGRRKSARFVHDECAEWLNDLEENGASVEELDDAFAHAEAVDQYDEGGAISTMSSHERTVACGRVDPEFTAEDLPERARHLAPELRRDYANGVGIEDIRDEINAQIEIIFPVSGKMENGARFYSHANRELQHFTRQTLEAILDECEQDFHLTALRNNRAYRQFHKAIRGAKDTCVVSETMKRAYEARQTGALPLKHFVALKAASTLQRERDEEREGKEPRLLFSTKEDSLSFWKAERVLTEGRTPAKDEVIHIAVSFRDVDFQRLGHDELARQQALKEVSREAVSEIAGELQAGDLRSRRGNSSQHRSSPPPSARSSKLPRP